MLIQIHVLVSEKNHLMFHQGSMNFLEYLVSKWFRNIYAAYFRTNNWTDGINLNSFVSHGFFLSYRPISLDKTGALISGARCEQDDAVFRVLPNPETLFGDGQDGDYSRPEFDHIGTQRPCTDYQFR